MTPSHARATANHGQQHDQAFDIHDTGTTRHGYEAQDDAAGPSRLQGKSSGKRKGKGKETGKSKVKPLKKVHKCTFEGCDKTFITPAHVRRHLRTHTGLQPYQCEFCEKRFARSDVRNRHMQLSHRELHDAWLQSQPPPDRQRQGSKSAGQERQSVDRAGGADGEDYGEIEDDDNDGGAMDAEEGDTTDTRHGAEDLVSFTIPGFLMDVDDTSNRPHAQTTTDTHTSSIRHAQSHSTHLQHHGTDAEPSRRESLSHSAPHTQTNTGGGNYGERQHGSLQHQSMSDTRPPQAQASFAMSNTGLPLDLPHDEDDMAGASYDHRQERYRHPADGPFARSASELSRYAISGQHYSQHGPGPRNDVHGSSADAARRDDSYAMFAEPQRTMGGARDNEEMLSRLDILLAAAAQPEDSATRGALAVANDDTSLPAGIHHQNNSQLVGTFVAANDISIVGNMDPTTSVPALPFPQNNPNSTITPEAFIASTMGLNPGTVPSVISGASPFDLYDVDLDMGLYHDVFGWGLGAADWQQLAATGQGTGDARAWTYDMLDLSILNLPTEAVGKIGNSSGTGGPFADAAANEMHGQSSTAVPQEQEAYNLDPGKQGSANAVPSMRASGRTTRQGTATPGNEEDTPWTAEIRVS
ncbi:hypothetical protein QFC21_006199 [Naganishia friedmannii]|uniref:Uncharacterized protein n=1 Tax=Naganishia friedmannii TaxID=89922 RepID=A0ACC2V4Q3_9TREE|nr:hypothetical protein QFC21_006199 [Naganishia friedmannii]